MKTATRTTPRLPALLASIASLALVLALGACGTDSAKCEQVCITVNSGDAYNPAPYDSGAYPDPPPSPSPTCMPVSDDCKDDDDPGRCTCEDFCGSGGSCSRGADDCSFSCGLP